MREIVGRLAIGKLSELTGVDPATLRTWETRYGVPVPHRTEGGQRRYDRTQVEKVRAMARLVDAGYRASEAARVVTSTWPGPEFGGLPATREDVASLLTEGDLAALSMLDRLAAAMTIEDVVIDFVVPIMREVGDRWAQGQLSVAEEHAASALVGSWLSAQMQTLPPPLRSGLVATATPPGERHELGLQMISLFVRRQGTPVLHLGSDLPVEDLVSLLVQRRPAAVCLAMSTDHAADGLRATIGELRKVLPEVPIGVGGPWLEDHPTPPGTIALPNDIRSAAAEVLALAS
ncbi:MAG: MerR family transcriptional regulator [Actinomycetota bacterium]|nr:MerR family transcriptional regulator [Actinomycetota bacterium]